MNKSKKKNDAMGQGIEKDLKRLIIQNCISKMTLHLISL